MRRHRSIRSLLIRNLVLGLLCLSALTAVIIYLMAQRVLTQQFDSALLAKARALASLVEHEDDGEYEFELGAGMMPEYERTDTPEYFQIWLPEGEVLRRSPSLKEQSLPRFARGNGQAEEYGNIVLADGIPVRAVELAFVPKREENDERKAGSGGDVSVPAGEGENTPRAVVVVAQSREPLDTSLAALLAVLLGGGLLMPLGGALLVLGVVQRGLQPLDALAKTVSTLGPDSLDQRFRPEDAPGELRPIQLRLNELLDRLQHAFERERRFTSDVSHELRTPLAEARTCVEMAARWPDDLALHENACGQALDALLQMQSLVSTLLLLARSDSGDVSVDLQRLDLGEMTAAILRSVEAETDARELTVSLKAVPDVQVASDRTLLTAVLRNLVDNATEYAPPGTSVEISIQNESELARWSVSNSAPDLTGDDVAKMFHPFWRKDLSRTGESHSGLGLSLVASFCQLLRIEVDGQLSTSGVLSVTLTFSGVENHFSQDAGTRKVPLAI